MKVVRKLRKKSWTRREPNFFNKGVWDKDILNISGDLRPHNNKNVHIYVYMYWQYCNITKKDKKKSYRIMFLAVIRPL